MKKSFKKLLTLLSLIIATSSFSKEKGEELVSLKITAKSILKLKYKNDSIKTDPYRILVAKGKTEYLKVLETTSWFKQKEELKKKEIVNIIQNELDANYLFMALSDFNFDTEGFDTAASYKNFLAEIVKIAGIQKEVNHLKVIKNENFINISVAVNSKFLEYSVNINEHQDWLDSNFIEQFINEQLLPKAKSDKKFFWLPAIDQIGNLIFVSKNEFEEATKIGLIPLDDIFME